MTRTLIITVATLALAVSTLQAQWKSETHSVKAGWTAIHPFVDASDVTLDVLLPASIVQVWRWNPGALDAVVLEAPGAPITGNEWSIWKRGFPVDSDFNRMLPNYGYLLKVTNGTAPFMLTIKGKAVMPRVQWRKAGLNLVGFPASDVVPLPTIGPYLEPPLLLDGATQVFRYVGGDLSVNNPVELLNPVYQALPRGEAFWVKTGKFSDYYGPVKVEVSLSPDGMLFGSSGAVHQIVLTNRTDHPVTATLEPADSETDRGGGTVSSTSLLERVFDAGTQSYIYPAFDGPRDVELDAGETKAVVVALDRSALSGAPGTENASLLVVTDSDGLGRIDVPVTATVSGRGGLWIGEALISRVQNQLQQFERDADGTYLYDGGGERIPLAGSGNNTLNATAQSYPLRLILHVDGAGNARLLSNVYAGPIATEVAEAEPAFGIATHESLLDADSLASAVRITSAHFPLDLDLGLTGSFGPGLSAEGTFTLAHDAGDNPFIHAFHPDHDNLNARFDNALAPGAESHTVDRALTLDFDSASPNGDPTWGSRILTGTYTEEVTGIHKNPISVEGAFFLRRLSEDEAINTPAP